MGGLPYSAQEAELERLFGSHGQVNSVDIITDRYTGQARGFAFVEMANDAEAQSAIDSLNGAQFGGRTLTVNEARSRDDGGTGGRGRGRH